MLRRRRAATGPRYTKLVRDRMKKTKDIDVTNKYMILDSWQVLDEVFFDDLQAAREAAINLVERGHDNKIIVEMVEQAQPIKPAIEVEITNVEARQEEAVSQVVCNAAHVPDATS